ncbi:Lysophospholipase, alpha-beta hydrolase superfamily [Hymenobacter psychrotolerans DSM 18569]|uniref:Lysophospholipase, alpha-beta hydrolase superfamily n=2 Tax=Hymenobacter psychrotolerans TaxID=344998 RepID=A0A1M6TQZ7_9BACT|nr:Lysophospholipase, alpha-beta hydrolase superfamily [Hymenobacter psychrotolerans DSM 18569]
MYVPDPLGPGFEQRHLPQPPDYEGPVRAVLVRQQPLPAASRAVLYVHGFNDYFFQREMAEQYAAHGFRFYALDLRKYGRALLPHQRPNNVRDLAEYFSDLDAALTVIRQEGAREVVLSGHSTGGLIAALYAHSRPAAGLAALVLNSPFLDLNQPRLKKLAVPLLTKLGAVWPNIPVPAGLPDTYGQSLHRAYRGHWDYDLAWKPNRVFAVNAGWLRAIRKAHQQVRRGLQIAAPILVLHSDRTAWGRAWSDDFRRSDIVLNVAHIRKLAPRLGPHVTAHAVAGGLHDLFLSVPEVRAEAYRAVFGWLEKVLPADTGASAI